MWSLANEFWYYILIPLAATIVLGHDRAGRRLFAITLLASAVLLLPWGLLEGGMIWAAGAAASQLAKQPFLASWLRYNGMRAFALGLALMALISTKIYSSRRPLRASVVRLSVAIGLPILAMLPSFGNPYRQLARGTAEISYTLYLVHFPFLMLIVMVELAPYRFQPGLAGLIVYLVLFTSVIAWAVAFWWCFERNTDRVFRVSLCPAAAAVGR